jgi:hypothetical protein
MGRWPAFWTYAPGDSCEDVNIMEHGGDLGPSTYTRSIAWDTEGPCGATPLEINQHNVAENLTTSYNTFAVEWMPNHAIFYYNNKMSLSYLGDYRVPIFYLDRIIVNFAIDIWVNQSITAFPSYFYIDWVKWYTLKTDCSTSVYADNFDFMNLNNYKLKKLFELKASTIPIGQNVTLRATDYILLGKNNGINGEFTVPLNAEFTAIINDCPN